MSNQIRRTVTISEDTYDAFCQLAATTGSSFSKTAGLMLDQVVPHVVQLTAALQVEPNDPDLSRSMIIEQVTAAKENLDQELFDFYLEDEQGRVTK